MGVLKTRLRSPWLTPHVWKCQLELLISDLSSLMCHGYLQSMKSDKEKQPRVQVMKLPEPTECLCRREASPGKTLERDHEEFSISLSPRGAHRVQQNILEEGAEQICC